MIGYRDGDFKHPIKRTKSGFPTKADALAYLPYLKQEPAKKQASITLKTAFDKWIVTHKATKSTLDCYRAGIKLFAPSFDIPMDYLNIDDLQDCLDPTKSGVRTRQNAKAALGLVYKWAIPRGYVKNNINLSQFLITGERTVVEKRAFTESEMEKIRQSIGKIRYADYIYCDCYLGFRPSELLDLQAKDYNPKLRAFTGGAKTDAGKNRIVPVSPKIQPIIDKLYSKSKGGYIFGTDGKRLMINTYRLYFYQALDKMGIQKADDHTITPHCCRHTFATLMKNVQAPDKDKMRLIGHASPEQLRYYQDVTLEDLRKIIDKI